MSARLDGEDPGLPSGRVDAHLSTCPACRSWAVAAGALTETVDETATGRPALNAMVLAALIDGASRPRRPVLSLTGWRVALILVGIMQLVVAWPGVVLDGGQASAHLAHELTSWDLGLATGFLVLAWLPSRAWGALPLVVVLVAAMVSISVVDLLNGHGLLGREVVHVMEIAGLACVWVLARRTPRPRAVLRLA